MTNGLKRINGFYAAAVCGAMFFFAHNARAATEAAGEHEGGGLPQLDASTFPSQLFWLAITFAILYLIFSRKSLPEISGVIENRKSHVESDLETAEKLKGEAEKAQHTYEASLQKARADAAGAMADVQEKIKAKSEEQVEAFRATSDKQVKALEKSLKTAKESAMDDMNTVAAEIASEAAKKIVGINADPEHAKTVVESLNGGANAKAA